MQKLTQTQKYCKQSDKAKKKMLLKVVAKSNADQRQVVTDAQNLKDCKPVGVSQWAQMGRRYGYWGYFQKEVYRQGGLEMLKMLELDSQLTEHYRNAWNNQFKTI